MPVVFIATQDEVYEKVVSNIQEVKAMGPNPGRRHRRRHQGSGLGRPHFEIPKVDDALAPLLTVIPMQLLSYHIALMRGATWTNRATLPRVSPWNDRRAT